MPRLFLKLDAAAVLGILAGLEAARGNLQDVLVDGDAKLADEDHAVVNNRNNSHASSVYAHFPMSDGAVIQSRLAGVYVEYLALVNALLVNPSLVHAYSLLSL
jgi:hypothetical protein